MDREYFCLYPINIDVSRSVKRGRKYVKDLCIPQPRYQEIVEALRRLEIEHVEEPQKKHPRDFFCNGRLKIKKKYGKRYVIKGLVQAVLKSREASDMKKDASEQRSCRKVTRGITQNGVYVENKLNLVPRKKKKGRRK